MFGLQGAHGSRPQFQNVAQPGNSHEAVKVAAKPTDRLNVVAHLPNQPSLKQPSKEQAPVTKPLEARTAVMLNPDKAARLRDARLALLREGAKPAQPGDGKPELQRLPAQNQRATPFSVVDSDSDSSESSASAGSRSELDDDMTDLDDLEVGRGRTDSISSDSDDDAFMKDLHSILGRPYSPKKEAQEDARIARKLEQELRRGVPEKSDPVLDSALIKAEREREARIEREMRRLVGGSDTQDG